MTLPALASISDLARRALGDADGIPAGSPEYVRAQVALEDASSLAREASGDLERWPEGPAEVPHPVARVVLAAARRWWQNPDGTTSESIGVGSISESKLATGVSVVLTPAEEKTCARYGRGAGSGARAFTIGVATSPHRGDVLDVEEL